MSGPADVWGIEPVRKVAAYVPMSAELMTEAVAMNCILHHTGTNDVVCSYCPTRIDLGLRADRIRDYEGPCRLTVDATITIQFPVTITVDKQAGEDPHDLHDRLTDVLRMDAWRQVQYATDADIELTDARVELP